MKKRFSMFPEPQMLNNYEFLRFLRLTISNKLEISEIPPNCSQSQQIVKNAI